MEQGFAVPSTTLTHPRVEVSFAPTRTFAGAFPKELAEQQKKFTTPTWAHRIDANDKGKEEAAPDIDVVAPVQAQIPKLKIHPAVALGVGVALFLATFYGVRYLRKLLVNG